MPAPTSCCSRSGSQPAAAAQANWPEVWRQVPDDLPPAEPKPFWVLQPLKAGFATCLQVFPGVILLPDAIPNAGLPRVPLHTPRSALPITTLLLP